MHNNKFLDKTIFLLIALFIIFLLFCELADYSRQAIFVNSIFIALLILSLCKNKFNLKRYFLDKKDFFFWLYLFLVSLNVWFSQNREISYNFYLNLCIPAFLIYFLIKNEFDLTDAKKALYIFFVCAGLVSLFGYIEMISGRNIIYERFITNYWYKRFIIKRMVSTFIHPNILGSFLVGSVPLGYYFYKRSISKKWRIFNLALFLLICGAVFLTFSRGSWMAALLALSVLAMLKGKPKYAVLILAVFLLFSVGCKYFFINSNFRTRFAIDYLWKYLLYSHRTKAYFVTAKMLTQRPFMGIGLGNYRLLFNQYSTVRLPYDLMIPDSVYLMHLAEAGLVGFAGFIFFLISIIRKVLIRCKCLVGNNRELAHAALAGFIGLILNMATYDGFLWRAPFYLFWVLAGILAGSRTGGFSST